MFERERNVVPAVRKPDASAGGTRTCRCSGGESVIGAPVDLTKIGNVPINRICEGSSDVGGGDLRAAGEDVQGRVAVLRPGVNREVALLDDDESRDAVGDKGVEGGFDDSGAGGLGSFDKTAL